MSPCSICVVLDYKFYFVSVDTYILSTYISVLKSRYSGKVKVLFYNNQGLFSGEIVRDSLIFLATISMKFAEWEEKSHCKMLLSRQILLIFPTEIHDFSQVLA